MWYSCKVLCKNVGGHVLLTWWRHKSAFTASCVKNKQTKRQTDRQLILLFRLGRARPRQTSHELMSIVCKTSHHNRSPCLFISQWFIFSLPSPLCRRVFKILNNISHQLKLKQRADEASSNIFLISILKGGMYLAIIRNLNSSVHGSTTRKYFHI